MDRTIDHYTGFEAEPEVQFITQDVHGNRLVVRMWVGYFDSIMNCIPPKGGQWQGIAYYYQMNTGWYDESPWLIPDACEARSQIEYSRSQLKDQQLVVICNDVLDLLNFALEYNQIVQIAYE